MYQPTDPEETGQPESRQPAPPDASPRGRVEFTPVAGGGDAGADAASVDPHWVELSALVARAEANRAEMARLQAERAEFCADALELVALRVAQRDAARPGREIGDTIPLREVLAELSAALRVGERTVSNWLGDGAALVGTYPATLEALRQGRIDDRHASAIIDAGLALTPENRAEYEALILPIAEGETAAGTRVHARVIAARLQPDIVEENQRRALAERRVRAFDLDDGLARLLLDAPAALVHGIFDRLTDMATALDDAIGAANDGTGHESGAAGETDATGSAGESANGADATAPVGRDDAAAADRYGGDADAAGDADADVVVPDGRTLDQKRADVLCDLLLTGAPALGGDAGLGAIRATVQVTIPILILAGLDDDPALLDGHSPIDPDTARALAAAAPCWQRVMIHPVTHEPLRLDTYRPSRRLRRLLQARDHRCRWPGCRRPARRCETDHTIAWEEGGPTCAGNLEHLCQKHHTLKHASLWTVRQLGGGTLEFTSPTRRTYRNNAPPVDTAPAARPLWAKYRDAIYTSGDPAPF